MFMLNDLRHYDLSNIDNPDQGTSPDKIEHSTGYIRNRPKYTVTFCMMGNENQVTDSLIRLWWADKNYKFRVLAGPDNREELCAADDIGDARVQFVGIKHKLWLVE